MSMRFLLALALCTIAFSAYAAPEADDVDVAVAAHDVARGDTLSADDLTVKSVSAARAGSSVIRSSEAAIGKEARRPLRAGDLIRDSDLKRPTIVAKGSAVTMVFESPGMQLTAMGKALAEGGQGDSITVLNPTSYRQVIATVIAPGTVRVTGNAVLNPIGSNPIGPNQIAQSEQ